MINNGVAMDAFFYSNLLDKLAKQGYWKETQTLFYKLKTSASVKLDLGFYNVILTHTARNGTLQEFLG
jgi:hypothetical protein